MISTEIYQVLRNCAALSIGSLILGIILLMIMYMTGRELPVKVDQNGVGNFFSIYNPFFTFRLMKKDLFSVNTLSILLINLGSFLLLITFIMLGYFGFVARKI